MTDTTSTESRCTRSASGRAMKLVASMPDSNDESVRPASADCSHIRRLLYTAMCTSTWSTSTEAASPTSAFNASGNPALASTRTRVNAANATSTTMMTDGPPWACSAPSRAIASASWARPSPGKFADGAIWSASRSNAPRVTAVPMARSIANQATASASTKSAVEMSRRLIFFICSAAESAARPLRGCASSVRSRSGGWGRAVSPSRSPRSSPRGRHDPRHAGDAAPPRGRAA